MTMTDDPDFLDELLTRYLDGDATDEVQGRDDQAGDAVSAYCAASEGSV